MINILYIGLGFVGIFILTSILKELAKWGAVLAFCYIALMAILKMFGG